MGIELWNSDRGQVTQDLNIQLAYSSHIGILVITMPNKISMRHDFNFI